MYDLAVVCRKAPAWASLSYMGRDGDAGVLCDHREDDLSANLHIIIEKEKKNMEKNYWCPVKVFITQLSEVIEVKGVSEVSDDTLE